MKKNCIASLIIAFTLILLNSNLLLSEQCITQEQLEAEVLKERKKWDINLDNQYGIEEIIYGLQLISALKNNQTWTNDFGMTFVLIQPGSFVMGSPESETGREQNEFQHSVTLTQAFYMQTTEVTQGQWKSVMGNNPSDFNSCGDDCPVETVSWEDAQEFIEKLNLHENTNRYRLPTEAQWEYSARAGTKTALPNGDLAETGCNMDINLDAIAWYCGNADDKTHPVAQKQANAWGLYDMHGNVWEWCQDWHGSYPTNSVTDPEGPSSGTYRVTRGGSWDKYAQNCRSAGGRRDSNPSSRYWNNGLRILRTIEDQ